MRSQQDQPRGVTQQSAPVEFAEVADVVKMYAPEFAARGFTLHDVTVDGPPPSIYFHFSNPRTDLLLDVSSFLARSSPKRGFNAMISTPDNRKLNVRNYLVRHGRSDVAELLTDNAPSDVRAFSEASIRLLLDLLDGELKPIVEGETFEETPIDWAGYK
jgi:hypothetical protein